MASSSSTLPTLCPNGTAEVMQRRWRCIRRGFDSPGCAARPWALRLGTFGATQHKQRDNPAPPGRRSTDVSSTDCCGGSAAPDNRGSGRADPRRCVGKIGASSADAEHRAQTNRNLPRGGVRPARTRRGATRRGLSRATAHLNDAHGCAWSGVTPISIAACACGCVA